MAGLNHLRFGCSQITIERLDPLVNPGLIPTPHIHQVVGGNAFNATIPGSDVSKIATCTTCGPADDFSNYWTANIYFKARNGSYRRVPQVPNRYVFPVKVFDAGSQCMRLFAYTTARIPVAVNQDDFASCHFEYGSWHDELGAQASKVVY